MSAFSDGRRREVFERAGGKCEYCRLPQEGQVATFPIDHVNPIIHGGTSNLENLALACPSCNAHKWTTVASTDPTTGEVVRLFHPRRDAWDEHFTWSLTERVLLGKTAVGRATIIALQINAETMVQLRRLLHRLGL